MIFKIIQLVLNFECKKFKVVAIQLGKWIKLCMIPPIDTGASARLKTMCDSSIVVRGPQLFNNLPISAVH